MRDTDESKDTQLSKDAVRQMGPKTAEGRAGMSGQPVEKPVEVSTPTGYGKLAHIYYAEKVDDALDNPEEGVWVHVEEEVTLPNGKFGRIDTRINNLIVDYKTDDMRNWTESKAKCMGREYGEQVQNYVESENTPNDATGMIVATGLLPTRPNVKEIYTKTLADYGVDIKYVPGAKPEKVVSTVKRAFREKGSY